ncbi:GBG12 protein, partial [Polyodon spathula]|nr:guanine nucleotide-binding protein G(I)/G(S)/G(O) subunit gamma-12-like [Polyodon spathula]XP_041091651.1 guanine nucleotide-binding protein G(I)/G(S)/G(O) subunit gamma-12-like [Polyodon spathula]XP_041091652.1 guanine nucleotide-binding protein G(I)/G(S)/G(O) subunit gamma-12-like [Polyodon spathula]XP_041091653.1 guanine nucleotide-binding protein G(I)/G(S)/G(O) subunit gamma-12-like [Polyodon spathula]MBN3285187.1 GBG12 protein [Polyodon spathula]MBN3285188.1 GBG12 protein [Polyodon spa
MSGTVCSSGAVTQAQRAVEQLRLEAATERIKISKAATELMLYCQENCRQDPLLSGVPASANPFKDKKTCILL